MGRDTTKRLSKNEDSNNFQTIALLHKKLINNFLGRNDRVKDDMSLCWGYNKKKKKSEKQTCVKNCVGLWRGGRKLTLFFSRAC